MTPPLDAGDRFMMKVCREPSPDFLDAILVGVSFGYAQLPFSIFPGHP
jgi:hypothetical protein